MARGASDHRLRRPIVLIGLVSLLGVCSALAHAELVRNALDLKNSATSGITIGLVPWPIFA